MIHSTLILPCIPESIPKALQKMGDFRHTKLMPAHDDAATQNAARQHEHRFLGCNGSVISSLPRINVLMKVGISLTANFGA